MTGITRTTVFICLCVAVALFSLFVSVVFGAASITFNDVFSSTFSLVTGQESQVSAIRERIIWELRAPRAVLAFLAGAGLSLAGAVLQTVTRNPLSDPYLFGISSGASFGAVLVIAALSGTSVSAISGFSEYSIAIGAFAGSLFSVVIVIALAGRSGNVERMLLAGVATSFMFSAATSLVLYLSDPLAAASLIFWTLGSFARAEWTSIGPVIVVLLISLLCFFAFSRPLKTMLAGDENAKALGVNVVRLRLGMLVMSSLMTAVLVANCGGIGFVGLMIPHIVRRLVIGLRVNLFVAVALVGGIFMVWVDVLARVLHEGTELPIGVITAALGSAFFLLVLVRRDARS